MLDRDSGKVVFICDNCEEARETGIRDLYDALALIKREGWRITKRWHDWEHICPQCQSDPDGSEE